MLFDPIKYYFKKIGCQHESINEIAIGEKYVAVILQSGQIGVCATLDHPIEKIQPAFSPDLRRMSHRIVYTAYLNALLNYQHEFDENKDIYDVISFEKYNHIVMIGHFKSLYQKFQKASIKLDVFDKAGTGEYLTDMGLQKKHLHSADAAIITGTSMFNRTFPGLIKVIPKTSDIFILGPSTILDKRIFEKTHVTALFGAVFDPHDRIVLKIIREGGGTPDFVDRMQKVFLLPD
ncbi:MAG: DUF364 domain-containing protein [Bacteroidales bacterium]|nr:DUF364 domain-containing protein [Bacteroidales bacterium]